MNSLFFSADSVSSASWVCCPGRGQKFTGLYVLNFVAFLSAKRFTRFLGFRPEYQNHLSLTQTRFSHATLPSMRLCTVVLGARVLKPPSGARKTRGGARFPTNLVVSTDTGKKIEERAGPSPNRPDGSRHSPGRSSRAHTWWNARENGMRARRRVRSSRTKMFMFETEFLF